MTVATERRRRYGGSARDRRVRFSGDNWSEDRQPAGEAPAGSGGAERLARGLGWFSIGLGLAQIAAPRRLARLIGVDDAEEARNTMLAIGLREITSGIGLLGRPRPTGWVWSRVAGDLMDLVLLGRVLKSDTAERRRVAAATAAVLGVTALDLIAGERLSSETNGSGAIGRRRATDRGIHVARAITINRPRSEIYSFWRNLENLPRFMEHLESVQVLDDRRSRWRARAPAGATVEWEAEVTEDRPNELIAWRSIGEADVPNFGRVLFKDAPARRGTEVIVELSYNPPGGKIGAIIAKLFGEEPSQQVEGDLRRLKQVMEIGEVVHSDASIHPGPHPARPPEDLSTVRL